MDPNPPKTYAYQDLIFLIRELPSILGERSIHGAVESACRSGGPGQSVPSSDEHHQHWIDRLGLDSPGAMNHAARARRLQAVWARLTTTTQRVLEVYYTPRVRWPFGFEALIGPELASVAQAWPPDGDEKRLRDACSMATKKAHEQLILRAQKEAYALVQEAHEEWDRVRRIVAPTKPKDIRKKAQQDTMAEIA